MAHMSIETFRKHLPVMKHRLDDELELLPQLMDQLAQQVNAAGSHLGSCKNELALTEARIYEDLRNSDEKLSVEASKHAMVRHQDRKRAWERYHTARQIHEEWLGLQEAYRQKSYAIKTLADLFSSNYYTLTTSSLTSSRSINPPRPASDAKDRQMQNERSEARVRYDHEFTPTRTKLMEDAAPRARTQVPRR